MDTPLDQSHVANCAAYGADGKKIRDITLDEISEVISDEGYTVE